jgi:hypothetical protein
LTRGVGTSKFFILKLIIQKKRIHNTKLSSNLKKIKELLMVFIGKAKFNIDGQTIHSTFSANINKFIKLSFDSLNRFTCQYEQLQVVIIDEISLITIKMFNVIHHQLKQ